jgi:hypothetical protein
MRNKTADRNARWGVLIDWRDEAVGETATASFCCLALYPIITKNNTRPGYPWDEAKHRGNSNAPHLSLLQVDTLLSARIIIQKTYKGQHYAHYLT